MKKTFMLRLKEVMEEKGLKQSDVTRLSGITQSSISDWLNGRYVPKQDKIDILARALNVSPAYLMGWDDESEQTTEKVSEIRTIAAHSNLPLTEKEMEKVLEFAKFIISQRGNEEQ